MLSKLLQRIFLSQMLMGGLLGWLIAWQTGGPGWLAAAGAAGLPLLMTLLLAISTAVKSRAPGAHRLWWRSLVCELGADIRIFACQLPWSHGSPGVLGASASPARVPVVLVHGYLCNHRIWDAVTQRLRRAGHPVLALDLEPLFTSIDLYAPLIEQAVTLLCQQTGEKKVALVGHSMGGLAIRAWMRAYGHDRVARVLTLGTPHVGSQMAPHIRTPNGQQMGWRSDWLQALNHSETDATRRLIRIALTPQDNIVYPQRAQVLEGVPVTVFEGRGHLELCLDKAVITWVVQQLENPDTPMLNPHDNDMPPARPRPESLRDLFWSFTYLALQGFGGVLAVVQRELVEKKKWLSHEEFLEDWAVAQILPGPNVVNLSLMIGDRYFGVRGALVALAGMLTFPLLLAVALAAAFAGVSDSPAVQGALRGMGSVAAGLIAATGLKLISALKTNVMGILVCGSLAGLTFVAIALLRIPLAWVLLGVGTVACGWAYRQLGKVQTAGVKS